MRRPFFSASWRPIVVAGAAYAITTVCVAIVFACSGHTPERRTSRFSISLPEMRRSIRCAGSIAVLSTDARRLRGDQPPDVRSCSFAPSIATSRRHRGHRGCERSVLLADAEWIGFFLARQSAKGSRRRRRADHHLRGPGRRRRDVDREHTIVFGGGPGGGLARVSASRRRSSVAPGDVPVVIATPAPESRELRLGWPDMLPGDRGVLFTAITLAGSDVGVLDLRTGRATMLAEQAAFRPLLTYRPRGVRAPRPPRSGALFAADADADERR
jgi:hypothetical protein